MEDLTFHLLFLGEHGVSLVIQTDADVLSIIPLYHTGHNIFLFMGEMFKKDSPLFFFDLLDNNASGVLGSNTSEILRSHLDVYHISQIIMEIPHLCVFKTDLCGRIFHFFHNCLLHENRNISGFSVHIDLHDGIFSKVSVTGCHQRILDCLHDHFFFDIFLFL